MENDQFSRSISEIVASEKPFSLKYFIINDDIEKKVETALTGIFTSYNRQDYVGVIYTCCLLYTSEAETVF